MIGALNGQFEPLEPITRESFATVLFRFAVFMDPDLDMDLASFSYAAADCIGSYA